MSTNLILRAAEIAQTAHHGQFRNWTKEPFVLHPARVAARLMLEREVPEEAVAAAFLHDVIEDTRFTEDHLEERGMPFKVIDLVRELTNASKGSTLSRAERKAMDREKLAKASYWAKVTKILDRIDNLHDMPQNASPESFLGIYLLESKLLLEVIGDAQPVLAGELGELIRRLQGG